MIEEKINCLQIKYMHQQQIYVYNIAKKDNICYKLKVNIKKWRNLNEEKMFN